MAGLEQILLQHPVWRGSAPEASYPVIPSTYPDLDSALPGGGWPGGVLTEILCGREGIGELELLLPALASLSWAGKRIVWLAPPHLPYAPALAAAGLDLAQFVLIQASRRRDALWAAEQVLRSRCCHALVGWFGRLAYDELRRLAVSAEGSPAFIALFRAPEAARESSPAALRLALEPQGTVQILKRRGAPATAPLHLPLKRPIHALGRTAFPIARARGARADRLLGLPVHA